MKSALELAMEKANEAVGGEDNIKLSDEQKVAIDQVRKLYEAKWAEKELQINGRTAQLQKENPEGLAEARAEVRLNSTVAAVRAGTCAGPVRSELFVIEWLHPTASPRDGGESPRGRSAHGVSV